MRSLIGIALALGVLSGAVGCGGDVDTTGSAGGAGGGGAGGFATTTTTSQGGTGAGTTTASTSSSGPTTTVTETSEGGGGSGAGGTGGGGGAVEGCTALAPIQLSKPEIADADQDGTWSPGEAASVFVTMTNTSDMDVQYPGVKIESDNPLVGPGGYNAFFVLFAGTAMPIEVGFEAKAETPPGTVVTLTATLVDIQATVCTELPSLSFDVTIQ